MAIINFYCVDGDINGFLYIFLQKLVEKNNKILMYSTNQEKALVLDKYLWSFRQLDFLPHLLSTDKGADKTPIVITNNFNNVNNANVLMITDFLDNYTFLEKFEKVIYIFTSSQEMFERTKEIWHKYKDFERVLYRKDNENKWQKIELF
jgi:DNA polymerase IIIc chi subunit